MIGSKNSKKLIKIVGLGMGISIMMVMMVINNYTQLRDALILNEQKHLLTIVEITAQSVKNHFLTEERSLELLSKDLRFIENFKKLEENRPGYTKEELIYYYKASYPSIKNIQLLDKSGKLLSEYPEKRDEEPTKVNFSELPEVQKLIKEKSFQTSEAYFIDKKPYIYQLQPIMIDGNLKGIIRSQLSIEHIYNKYIKQIRSGEKGYASIKNGDGIFLMHPVDEQIGKDSVELRREINPNYEWKELEELFLDQKAKKNGTKIYHSTWTEEINPKVVKKFNAYASIELKDVFWIVTLSTDYDEVVSRIKKNYYMTILTSSMIVLSFTFIVIYIYITKERKRKLEVENSYLIQLKKLNKELEGDIEKRKRLEKKLLKTMEENKRKEAIMIHQSRHAAMGEMIGNIAHQWRQPLSSLSLLISNIEDIILYGEDDKKYIEDVFRRSRFLLKRMSETIDDFSNFFKPKSNKETFDIKRLVDITQNICSERLKHNNIILTNSVDKDIRIIGYFNQLSQVMLNIVNNGIDAIISKGNSGKIHITATANQKKDIEIIIEDNGGGIPENLINNIFEPYFSTKDEKNGTGIGLHMSKIIVENNFSGKIQAYNGSKGAIFKIIIPGKEE